MERVAARAAVGFSAMVQQELPVASSRQEDQNVFHEPLSKQVFVGVDVRAEFGKGTVATFKTEPASITRSDFGSSRE
jgi:hypothetical protein